MTREEPRHLLVQARGDESPLYEARNNGWWAERTDAFTVGIRLDDKSLALPADLVDLLRSRSVGSLRTSRRLARHLGRSWAVRHWEEGRRQITWVCWSCDRLHWEPDPHDSPPPPVDITVEGEFQYGPLRAEGFGDFFPDDPAAALDLSDGLVAGLYTWAADIDATVNLDLRDRVEGKYDSAWERLYQEGAELARRVAREVGPERVVTYTGTVNGGLAALTRVAWRGERQV